MLLVSAILPTRGRQDWARVAVQCFESQTYSHKELVILDDADEPSFPDAVPLPSTYCRTSVRDIGTKRNHCCRLAKGDIIWHLDSDDWSAPERMNEQVKQLEESGKDLVGYCSMLFYAEHLEETKRYYRYQHTPSWALGTSLTYKKSFWNSHPFPQNKNRNSGEDNDMVTTARHAKRFSAFEGNQMMVARIHTGNTATKTLRSPQYRAVTRSDFPEAFFQ